MEFLFSIAKNELEKVRSMIQSGTDVNNGFTWNSKNTYSPVIPKDISQKTLNELQMDQEYLCKPLNIAVLGGHPNMVRLLLSAGADINVKDGRGRTALVCAIYGLDLDASNINPSNLHYISQTNASHFDIMKNILLCHPNLDSKTLDSPQYEIKGITPLCLASYLGKADIIQLLLDDGRVNVDGTDSKNATALMYAARDGNIPIVSMLLSYRASPDITDSHGWSAIQFAERSPEIVQLCEEALRVKRLEYSPLSNCKVKYPTNYSKLSHLIETIPKFPSSLSHLEFDVLKQVDYLDPAAAPLVHIIQTAFLQAIKIHDHLSLQTLLIPKSKGGPLLVNHHDPKTGLTAFHHAMRTKPLPSLDTITMLYQAGADVNAQTYYGRTALHHLARFGLNKDQKTWGIQKSNKEDRSSQPPTSPPLSSSCVPETTNFSFHLAMCTSMLIQFGALVNIGDPTGNTPLHFAAEFGGVPEVLEILIVEGNADLNWRNKKGETPLDVCKSEEIHQKIMAFESERKNSINRRSVISYQSSTIRPFDSASEYRSSSLSRSISRSTVQSSFFQDKRKQKQKRFLSNGDHTEFEIVLRAFFNYQTTLTDSIETSLAFITDSILGPWENVSMVLQVERTIVQLRLQLREAHEMFDVTDQRVEKAMMLFREELEQVEQIHQSDWEMSELQNDKIEKLFDVFERIDGRFCQLDLTQDELIQQLEGIRKYAQQKLSFKTPATQEEPIIKDEELGIAIAHLIQTFSIIQTVPIDPVLYLRDDRARLCKDLSTVVDQLLKEVNQFIDHKKKSEPIDEPRIQQLTDARNTLERRWSNANTILTKQKENNSKLLQEDQKPQRPLYQPLAAWKKDVPQLYSSKNPDSPSLNQLELSFDIHHSNLGEIQKDIEELTSQSENIMKSKKKMYDMCLSLEQELNKQQQHENGDKKRAVDEIQSELNQVLAYTKKLFDEQAKLEKEREQLKKEQDDILKELDTTEGHLSKVRPPLLLQGLLERLETDEAPIVRVEKDWKEDLSLVAEITDPENDSQTDDSYSTDDSEKSAGIGSLPLNLLASQYSSPLLKSCYTARLDSSLYCLKVLASHQIGKSKQHLLEVHASLNRATVDLDEIRKNMAVLYDDAAEVAQQVFVLKTELETIVRHRKEEVIKVWEVVDEVSEGVNARALELQQNQAIQNQQRGPNNPQQHQKQPNAVHEVPSHGSREEEKDRHQWIVRELEQLQHVHDGLEDSIEGLKREQVVIGENLKQLATTLIEPQVDRLVGSEDDSILSVSDKLAELMDRIKDSELGLKPTSFWSNTAAKKKPQTAIPASPTPVVNGVGVGPRPPKINNPNRLSRLSAATNRLSVSTYASESSHTARSIKDKRVSTAISIRTDKKRMSMVSTTSLSSLSSYQQERMMARASSLSSALSQTSSRGPKTVSFGNK